MIDAIKREQTKTEKMTMQFVELLYVCWHVFQRFSYLFYFGKLDFENGLMAGNEAVRDNQNLQASEADEVRLTNNRGTFNRQKTGLFRTSQRNNLSRLQGQNWTILAHTQTQKGRLAQSDSSEARWI